MRNRDESNLSAAFMEGMLEDYLRDRRSVPADWHAYFKELLQHEGPAKGPRAETPPRHSETWRPRGNDRQQTGNGHRQPAGNGQDVQGLLARQDRVDQLIRNYRVRGHMLAQLDPLGRPRPPVPELDPAFFGLTEADFDLSFSTDSMPGPKVRTLRQILQRLQAAYCRSIGVQFMHIDDVAIRRWIQDRIEGTENPLHLSKDQQLHIFKRLTDAVVFEQVVRKKYVGATTFSLEGAETLIPLLDLAIEKGAEQGLAEIVLAMSHRGRLNVLVNIMGKSPVEIFREFEDVGPASRHGGGDVKYHLGYSSTWQTAGAPCVHLSLCFNPSHLEFINPVALGRTRAKQDRAGDRQGDRGMALLIHTDAGFAGQGVVQEMLNLSQLPAYGTGGALHVVVNNQIGFTTPPEQGRSSVYATDVTKMLKIPIFHVNGEDPEAAATVVRMAMDFRHEFHRDVVIDMYCYRRHGHNEGDEPTFTQPQMYEAIAQRPPVWEGYLEHLTQHGDVTRGQAEEFIAEKTRELEEAHAHATTQTTPEEARGPRRGVWAGYVGGSSENAAEIATGVERGRLAELLEALARLPADFHLHRKIERGLAGRREMAQGKRPLDWSAAEAVALASLAVEGRRVRMTGQDSERGTFSQRHAVLHDVTDGHTFVPLQHLAPDQAPVDVCNSPLSETAVLGFDYGYSMDYPEALVLWEAQYGDFCNVAQVIIDQFICSAEEKWNRLSGLVMLLPHGFEGQGPEHSSARLERWLALGADDNIQVVYPTTPAQYFHVLRRQVLSRWRKPLVVMTPKGLLRHPQAVSSLEDCIGESFQLVLQDVMGGGSADTSKVQRVLLCSGKIYYELAGYRAETKHADTAILRLEQLYPLPRPALRAALERYPVSARAYWVQEEPRNMGAWPYLRDNLGCELLFDRLPFAGIFRPESASPGTGSPKAHKLEQQRLIQEAFGDV